MSSRKFEQRKSEQFELVDTKVTEVHSTIKERADSLVEFEKYLNDLPNKYSNLNEAEQEAFLESMDEISAKAKSAEGVTDLLELYSSTISAYNSPLRSSIQSLQTEILETVNLQNNDKLHRTINKTTTDEFTDAADAREQYQTLKRELDTLDDIQLGRFRGYLENSPTQLLYPDELNEYINELRERKTLLSEFDMSLQNKEWWPEKAPSLTDISDLYEGPLNESDTKATIETISDQVDRLEQVGINAGETTKKQIHRERDEIESLTPFLESLKNQLKAILKNEDALLNIFNLHTSDITDAAEATFATEIDQLTSESLNQLNDEVISLVQKYEDWIDEQSSEWERVTAQVSQLTPQLGPDKTPPDDVKTALHTPIFSTREVTEAFRIYLEAESWVQQQLSNIVDDLNPEAADLLDRLLTEGTASISEDDVEPVEELLQYVDLKVEFDD